MKVIDITDKLNFEQKPQLKIKGKTYPVNNDAKTMLEIMQITEGNIKPTDFKKMYDGLFDEEIRRQIDELKLNLTDFQTVITSAVQAVTGQENKPGEAVTPGTTSSKTGT